MKPLCLALLYFAVAALAAFDGREWNVFLNTVPPASYDRIPAAPSVTVKMAGDTIDLARLAGGFHAGAEAVLYCEFEAAEARTVRAGAAADWWMEIYLNGELILSTMAQGNRVEINRNAYVFDLPLKQGKNLLAARVKSGSSGWKFVLGTPDPAKPNRVFTANDEWKVVDMTDLAVKPGSALDQSAFSENPRIGGGNALPRIGIGADGKLIVEGRPDLSVRFRGSGSHTTWLFGHARKNPDWKLIWRKNAAMARTQGYNLIRLWTDSLCTSGEDMVISPDTLDKMDYFIATLNEQRIYTFLTVGSYGLYLKAKYWETPAPGERLDYKARMYLGDPQLRLAWKTGVETLMNRINPYTGRAWKDDPAIACVELYNEQEFGLLRPEKFAPATRNEFNVKFREYLKRKYGTLQRLAQMWGEKAPESWEAIEIPNAFPAGSKSRCDDDFALLCTELSVENATWMRDTLRATGYRGLVAQYNLSRWFGGQEARFQTTQLSISNTYFNHPSNFDRPGSRCRQNSSIESAASYWRDVAVMRFADRPMMVTEYNHPFWNKYQYEGGLLFGAYSALQGFDGLMVHDEPVFHYLGEGVDCFAVGRSPVLRAGEFVLANLFMRRDVKPSPHRVELQIPRSFLEQPGNSALSVSWEQSKLALLTGFSVALPGLKPESGVGTAPAPDFAIAPDGGSELKAAGGGWALEASDRANGRFTAAGAVASMKKLGVLPVDNASDPGSEIFQSDTGEITLRRKDKVLTVVTPRTEGAALPENRGERLGVLNIVRSSVPAMVAACSVDGAALADSRRIVLVYSTRAANSGMELSADEVTLVKRGTTPVLLQTGKLELVLKNSNKLSLYALGFDGSRREKLPVKSSGKALAISIDTGILKDGPAAFFELVAE